MHNEHMIMDPSGEGAKKTDTLKFTPDAQTICTYVEPYRLRTINTLARPSQQTQPSFAALRPTEIVRARMVKTLRNPTTKHMSHRTAWT